MGFGNLHPNKKFTLTTKTKNIPVNHSTQKIKKALCLLTDMQQIFAQKSFESNGMTIKLMIETCKGLKVAYRKVAS